MREIDHNNKNYGGGPHETASIRIEADGTNHMVNYSVDGGGIQTLPKGQKLTVPMKATVGDSTTLQVNLEYSADGTYTVAVENIPNCVIDTNHTNECVRTYSDFDIGTTLNFIFFTE
jgi:hypothetical protein